MLRKGLFLILVCFWLFCEQIGSKTPRRKTLLGEWVYAGTFDSRQSYKCYVCEGFEPSASIYSINFLTESNYSGRVNLLLIKGEYVLSDIKNTEKDLPQVLKILIWKF
ncbi:MAG: hypothetical protein IPO04_03810 [Cytophagaceae bacterium]|nr:hypothetical protein [Cytophagaceae bacterium]